MNNKRQQHTAIATVIVTLVFAVIFYIISLKHAAELPMQYVFQLANILLGTAFISLLSTLDAYFEKLAVDESVREKKLDDSSGLFDNEADSLGRHQRVAVQFRKNILPVLLITISTIEIALSIQAVNFQKPLNVDLLKTNLSPMLLICCFSLFSVVVFFLFGKFLSGRAYGDKERFLRPICGFVKYSMLASLWVGLVTLLYYWQVKTLSTWAEWPLVLCSWFLAIERLLVWFIDFYRPRNKYSETLPVYESRVLTLFSQPQGFLINFSSLVEYQLGLKASQGLLQAIIKKVILPFVALKIIVLLLLSCLIYVQPHETALVESWGSPDYKALDPGLGIQLPWPTARHTRVPTSRIHQIIIQPSTQEKPSATSPYLWSTPLPNSELYVIGSSKEPVGISLAVASLTIDYRIRNAVDYHNSSMNPNEILRILSRQALMRYLLNSDLDILLKSDLQDVSKAIHAQLQSSVDQCKLGTEILKVAIPRLRPPPQVAPEFQQRIIAEEVSKKINDQAMAYSVKTNLEGKLKALDLIKDAKAKHSLAIEVAKVEKENFEAKYKVCKQHPQLYKIRETMDVLEIYLPEIRKVINTTRNKIELINLELKKAGPDLLNIVDTNGEASD